MKQKFKDKIKLVLIGVLIVIAVPVTFYIVDIYFLNPLGYKNLKICDELTPGISAEEIIKKLGKPLHKEEDKDNSEYHWISFETPSIMAGLIRARINKSTGAVVTLRCHEDGPASWDISKTK